MDDWSHIPARNAVSEPAPDPQSTMTTTALPASLTHPRQAPATGTDHPCAHTGCLTRAPSPGDLAPNPGLRPETAGNSGTSPIREAEQHTNVNGSHPQALDITQPFMDDIRAFVRAGRRTLTFAPERDASP